MMDCQECQQRPATLHFTKIVNGQKMEYHLCDQCAREKGEAMAGSTGFSIHNLLSGFLNFEHPLEDTNASQQATSTLHCEKCGLTYDRFAKIGKFGCDQCYKTFNHNLDPILKKVHSGNTTHIGKIPKRMGSDIQNRRKVTSLRQELQRLIENEEFERAAEVRDEIRSLGKRGND